MSRLCLIVCAALLIAAPVGAAETPAVFARDNLVAWCIVPFDAKRRSPEERAEMLARLGFKKYAYDWRDEHLPTFERELEALKKHGVELTAVWFPAALSADAKKLLAALKKHGVKTQLWVTMGGGGPAKTPEEQRRKVSEHAAALRPIAEAAAEIGCTVGLYNHGSWFGEPENQLAILDALKRPNVGLVYNLHHGHDHLDRFPELLRRMKPHLYALNLNGMVRDGDKRGRKILPLGQGEFDLGLLKTIAASGYTGPIGILGHTNDDAEERLKDNLDGLDWLLPQLAGKPAGPRPNPRTPVAAASPAPVATQGWLADGRPEYRTPPLTVEVRARLRSKSGYNILTASDTKASAAHWELFTTPGDGFLTAYLPGWSPDHFRSNVDIADGKWHTITLELKEGVRLYVDGRQKVDQRARLVRADVVPGGLAFGRLVEGGIGCDGELAWARICNDVVELYAGAQAPAVDADTVGLWTFGKPDEPAVDRSPLKNTAKVAAPVPTPGTVMPPPGPHLKSNIPSLKAVLIDRSPNDAYMAVKADGAGRLFVGGREAVFVFEPDGRGGFLSRRELLRLPPDSIVIGLEYRGDDLYVQTVNALYLVPGGRVKREGLSLKRLLWGVPQDLHVSFHCLAWGPQGDLYLNHGDPLLGYGDWSRPDHWGHWTLFPRPEGTKVPYTGTGAVLSIRPDGTGLKVVGTGLRGPVGLAFDRNWELFTNDNDHESRADLYAPAKLLHVTPHADFGWPRGWMASKSPDRIDLLEPVNSAMGRGVPCDQLVYDEPMLPELRNNLLLCRWDRMGVTRFPLKPRGASFQAEELPFLVGDSQARPTGIAADRAGRLFVTCHYLGGNVVSPHCVSDLVMFTRDPVPADPLGDEARAPTDKLWTALSSPSGEARRRAHNELLRRGGEELKSAVCKLSAASPDDPAAVHLPWLAAARGDASVIDRLSKVATSHARPEVRLQAVRALADFPARTVPREVFLSALAGPAPPVRLAALSWLITAEGPLPLKEAFAAAQDADPSLRQTALTLLARRAGMNDLERLAQGSNAPERVVAMAAAGIRLTVPPPNGVPPQGLALHYPKGSPFFHRELRFADDPKPVDLADLGPVGSYTTAQRWKAVPPTPERTKLFGLLVRGLDDSDDRVKAQAAYYLGLLRDPRTEPVIERVTRELKAGGLAALPPAPVRAAWLVGPFPSASAHHAVENGPIDLAAEYPAAGGKVGWRKVEAANGALMWSAESGGVAYAYVQLQSRTRQPAALTVAASGAPRVWHNGRPIAAANGPTLLDLQPGGNDLLIRVTGSRPFTLAVRAKDRVTVALPERADAALLAERLRQASGSAKVAPEFLAVDWAKEAHTGDAGRGRKLFGSLGCVKCHAITPEQAGGGAPSLADAGKRFTPTALVEAILTPSRQVADDYRTTRVQLADGQALLGLLVKDTPGEIELLLPDTTRRTIKAAEVEDRRVVPGSPMPAGVVRTPAELRDLLAYLLSDRPAPP